MSPLHEALRALALALEPASRFRGVPRALAALALASSCATSVEAPPEDLRPRAATPRPAPASARRALLVHGGRVRVDAFSEPVEALLSVAGQVVFVGSEAEARARAAEVLAEAEAGSEGPRSELVELDLEGGTAVPGLQDAHGHLESFGATLEEVDLRDVASYAELVLRVAERARTLPTNAWITGRGWDHTLWPGAHFPHHAALSEAVPDHPVCVRRVDGHAALCNARALELAGLDRPVADLAVAAGGEIHAGDDGLPSGLLVDTAMTLVDRVVPPPDRATRRRRILRAQEELLATGLTCVHDMGSPVSTVEILRELAREDLLRLRVVLYLAGNDGLPGDVLDGYPADFAGELFPDRLSVPGVKLMIDGALGSRGAALLSDYSDRPGARGLLRFEPRAFEELVRTYARAGLQPATHAIGDAANRLVLDAYEAVEAEIEGFAALLPRVEHAQVVAPGDLARFAELDVVPSVQPTHATTDMRWAAERIGEERMVGAYAWHELDPSGLTLALGSDFPVESPDPRLGLFAARTRQDTHGEPPEGFVPRERLDGATALFGFTAGAARAAHQAARRGTLDPGKYADLTVLDVDPVTCDPQKLLSARVRAVVIDGRVVFPFGR